MICTLSSNLIHLGLEKGDRVALILPNCPQFVISYYAILKAGGVVVALNPNFTLEEYRFLMRDSDPKMVICQQKHLEMIREVFPVKEENHVLISGFPDEGITSASSLVFSDFKEKNEHDFPCLTHNLSQPAENVFPIVSPSDPAIFQYSGGTTGIPKAAIGLHQNIMANVTQFIYWCDLRKYQEVILAAIPLYHVYGMVLAMNLGASLRSTVVLIDDPRDFNYILGEIESQGVNFFPGCSHLIPWHKPK
jgi:long-chain acyl-CoA synthetase